jgi:hypothetical protein
MHQRRADIILAIDAHHPKLLIAHGTEAVFSNAA